MYYSHFKAEKTDTKIMVQPTIHSQISVRTEVQDFLTNVFLQEFLIRYRPLKSEILKLFPQKHENSKKYVMCIHRF